MKKIIFSAVLSSLSFYSIAGCPPPEIHWTPMPCIPQSVQTISGSNADLYLQKIQADMTMSGTTISNTINQTMADLSSTVAKSSNDIQATTIKINQENLQKQVNLNKMFNDQKYTFELDRLRKEELKSRTVFFEDDTPQEIDLIVKALEENPTLSVREVALVLKMNYDDVGGTIPIPLHGSEQVCKKEDLENGLCSTPKKITPARKLLKMHEECSIVKSKLVSNLREQKATNGVIKNSTLKSNNAIKQTNANAISKKINSQKEISCTLEQYKNNYCGQNLTPEEYQEKIVRNEIIVNANISPSNMLTPTSVGAIGTSLVDPQVLEVYEREALDYSELEANPHQKEDQVPIVYTYRNSNQLKGSFDYVDNVVGYDLIPNQSIQDIKKVQSLEYQSRYNSRVANLNLVSSTFNDSIKLRVGEKLGEKLNEDPLLEETTEIVKESALGAGKLDSLYSEVEKPFASLMMNGDDLDSAIKQEMLNGQGGDKYWKSKQLALLKYQQELLLREYLQNERSILLKSSQLSNMVNSVENTLYLKQLRQGGN